MSTAVVQNFRDPTTSKEVDAQYVTDGTVKASVQGNGSASIIGSLNISSSTDDGTGQYTYSFSAAFSDTTYRSVASWGPQTGGRFATVRGITTNSFTLGCNTPGGNFIDGNHCCHASGDLA